MKLLIISIILLSSLSFFVSAAETCESLGNPENCVELIPEQSGTHYTYNSEHDTYFLDDTADADYYFLLMGDLSCDKSCIIPRWSSEQSVSYTTTIDLNGYTMTYSDADYGSLVNNGFEEWIGNDPVGWTVISADDLVEPRSTAYWQPMSGNYVLFSNSSFIIESSYVNIPLIN